MGYKLEFRSTLLVVNELIFICVRMGLRGSRALGLGLE